MSNVFHITHKVLAYECDFSGRASLPMLIAMTMIASREQERILGIPNVHETKGLAWVIIQNQIDIIRFPKYEEVITIETEPLSYNKFFTYRRYTIFDENEEKIAETIATFSMIDLSKRKMVPVDLEVLNCYGIGDSKEIRRSTKLREIQEPQMEKDYSVRVLDIDYNGHVNNTRYFDWVLDTLGMDFLQKHRLMRLTVKYEKEVRPGSQVTSLAEVSSEDATGLVETSHTIKDAEQRFCQMNAKWEKLS
ncbi:acyl-[acyl-carrier-protein] thioesterase [Granulicatella seriolae]|uniref:Thioesterase n=1 Tax=Granulicatella seriolae TaxID=2967226 RepID=A0ABT1WMZ4_9LACT|nr:acyl-ACP thioesterase domain-containing protein [Granulicatella seriolae]